MASYFLQPKSQEEREKNFLNNVVALETLQQFPKEEGRSGKIIYATTLPDCRQVWIKGADVTQFIVDGVVTMNGTCKLTDGTLSPIKISIDPNDDNVKVKSLLKMMTRPAGLSEAEWEKKIGLGALEGMPQSVINSIGQLADEFLAGIKPIVEFRKATEERVRAELRSTSSPAPESQE